MSAYVIADMTVTKPEPYEAYKAQVQATLEPFGGKFAARGATCHVMEGDWEPQRLVMIEFPDVAAAMAWYNSDAYAPLLALRKSASTGRLVIVEGL